MILSPARLGVAMALCAGCVGLAGDRVAAADVGDAAPASFRCEGHTATIVGTPSADIIRGTPAMDVIVARGGNDTVRAADGDDIICGGRGRDQIHGGKGREVINDGRGDDRVWAGMAEFIASPGDDYYDGRHGDTVGFKALFTARRSPSPVTIDLSHHLAKGDWIGVDRLDHVSAVAGAPGQADRLVGNGRDNGFHVGAGDVAVGGRGGDRFVMHGGQARGGRGSDRFGISGAASAVASGGTGPDFFDVGRSASATIDGGDGTDTISPSSTVYRDGGYAGSIDLMAGTVVFTSASDVATAAVTSIEDAFGTGQADTLRGNDVANVLHGSDGDDTMTGLGGDDILYAGYGQDSADGGDGIDQCLSAETTTNCETTSA